MSDARCHGSVDDAYVSDCVCREVPWRRRSLRASRPCVGRSTAREWRSPRSRADRARRQRRCASSPTSTRRTNRVAIAESASARACRRRPIRVDVAAREGDPSARRAFVDVVHHLAAPVLHAIIGGERIAPTRFVSRSRARRTPRSAIIHCGCGEDRGSTSSRDRDTDCSSRTWRCRHCRGGNSPCCRPGRWCFRGAAADSRG